MALFGAAMAYNGWVLGQSVHELQDPEPRPARGACATCRWCSRACSIVLFSIEHIIALLRGEEVEPVMALTILGVTFFGFLVLGVPVAFAIGLSAVCTILYEGLPVAVLFQQMMSGMNIFSFLAIPFFVFSGELMLHGGIADKIVAARAAAWSATSAAGSACPTWSPARCSAACAGSPVADVSAMGSVMIPMMKREGYHADYAVNVTTHAALVGALMPTSHNMIIYALAAGGTASIGALILAGHRAGAAADGLQSGRRLLRGGQARLPGAGTLPRLGAMWRSIAAAAARACWSIVIILAGILSGVFTATESASVAVIYSIAADLLPLPHDDAGSNFLKAAAKAVKTTGVVLLLIGVSTMFQYLMGALRGGRPRRAS